MNATSGNAARSEASSAQDARAGKRPQTAAPSTKRRAARYVIGALLLVVAAAGWGLPRLHFSKLVSQLDAADPKVRHRAAKEIGSLRDPKGVEPMVRRLAVERDRGIAEMIVYGLAKIEDPRAFQPIQEAITDGPDDIYTAKMLQHLAKMAPEEAHDFLRAQLAETGPWKKIGAASGLLEANDPAGGPVLLDAMQRGDQAQRLFAAQGLLRYVVPMMDMIGQRPKDLDPAPTAPLGPEQVETVKNWWAQAPTDRLLNDYVIWHRRPNPKWRKIQRLLHARDRLAGFFGADEEQDG